MTNYKVLDEPLQKVLKGSVSLDDDSRKQYSAALKQLYEQLLGLMQQQEDFKELYRQTQYVGSYYENLRVETPDEFDIDLELFIPEYVGVLQPCQSTDPGFCHLKLKENSSAQPNRKEKVVAVVKKMCENGYLLKDRVHQWMTGVVDKAITLLNNQDKTFKISRSVSGPAVTLSVSLISKPDIKFSVDFVPVFVFAEWPTVVQNIRKWKQEMVEKKWYAVPKSKNENQRNFRISFWHQEKHLLSGANQMKPALKLIKKLRDIYQWSPLSSYYIKTVFLWKNEEFGKPWWSKSLGEIFVEIIKTLKIFLLDDKKLPFFWVKSNDLISHLKPVLKENIGNFFCKMQKKIEMNIEKPDFVLSYFNLETKINNSDSRCSGNSDQATIKEQKQDDSIFIGNNTVNVQHASEIKKTFDENMVHSFNKIKITDTTDSVNYVFGCHARQFSTKATSTQYCGNNLSVQHEESEAELQSLKAELLEIKKGHLKELNKLRLKKELLDLEIEHISSECSKSIVLHQLKGSGNIELALCRMEIDHVRKENAIVMEIEQLEIKLRNIILENKKLELSFLKNNV